LQLFLVRPRNLAGPWKAGNLEALVYFKFNRYQAVLRFFEVPISGTFLNYIKPIRKNAGYNDGAKYKEYGLFGSEFPLPW